MAAPLEKGKRGNAKAGSGVAAKTKSRGRGAPKSTANQCREPGCEKDMETTYYCRLHYIKNWTKIKRKERLLREHKLDHFIHELVNKYPEKYMEIVRADLATEAAFLKVAAEMNFGVGDPEEELVDERAAGESEDFVPGFKRGYDDDDETFTSLEDGVIGQDDDEF